MKTLFRSILFTFTLSLCFKVYSVPLSLEDRHMSEEKKQSVTSKTVDFDSVIFLKGPIHSVRPDYVGKGSAERINVGSIQVLLMSSTSGVLINYEIPDGNRSWLGERYIQEINKPETKQKLWESNAFQYIRGNDLLDLLRTVTTSNPMRLTIHNWNGYRSIGKAEFIDIPEVIAIKHGYAPPRIQNGGAISCVALLNPNAISPVKELPF